MVGDNIVEIARELVTGILYGDLRRLSLAGRLLCDAAAHQLTDEPRDREHTKERHPVDQPVARTRQVQEECERRIDNDGRNLIGQTARTLIRRERIDRHEYPEAGNTSVRPKQLASAERTTNEQQGEGWSDAA
jgi:hypothetical protein